jgi:hypothetical protein
VTSVLARVISSRPRRRSGSPARRGSDRSAVGRPSVAGMRLPGRTRSGRSGSGRRVPAAGRRSWVLLPVKMPSGLAGHAPFSLCTAPRPGGPRASGRATRPRGRGRPAGQTGRATCPDRPTVRGGLGMSPHSDVPTSGGSKRKASPSIRCGMASRRGETTRRQWAKWLGTKLQAWQHRKCRPMLRSITPKRARL